MINGMGITVGSRHCSAVQDGDIICMNPTQANMMVIILSAWLKRPEVKSQVQPPTYGGDILRVPRSERD